MVVAIIICYIKEVLTAEGGRGHATQHLAANGFWGGTFERTCILYSDVFLPRRTQLSSVYRKHERIKNSESNIL